MPATKKATISTQGRRVRPFQHQVPSAIDVLPLFAGVAAPKQKHHIVTLPVNRFDHFVSKGSPTLPLVRASTRLLYRQHGVKQQYTLISPWLKTPVIRRRNVQV